MVVKALLAHELSGQRRRVEESAPVDSAGRRSIYLASPFILETMRHPPFAALLSVLLVAACSRGPTYDLVIANGRVMDPESGLDTVRNVGVRAGRPLDGAPRGRDQRHSSAPFFQM